MSQDAAKKPEETATINSGKGTSRLQGVASICLVALLIIGNIALMFNYSRSIFNSTVAENVAATAQNQAAMTQAAMAAPTQTAVSATEEAARSIVPGMTATAIANVNVTAVAKAKALSVPYPPSTSPVIDDQLTDSSSSKGDTWEVGADYSGGCNFTNGAYQITVSSRKFFEYCLARPEAFVNFIYEVQMMITQGDGGGLIFHADDSGKMFYHFLVNQDGTYAFSVFDLNRNLNGTVLASGSSQFISTGWNTPNILAIIVSDGVFQLYVNHHQIAVVGDGSYSRGLIGLFADYETASTTVIFRALKVWIE